MAVDSIKVLGAEEHNLKNIDVEFERGAITVITGVSGSGKSSLVFDTVLAEARRRFFFTLSHYSRQFLDLTSRPKVRSVTGLSPTISLAQNETPPSRRATVGTLTDLSELFGILFSRFGMQHCPTHGGTTAALTAPMIVDHLLAAAQGKMVVLCAPIAESKKGAFKAPLMMLAGKGYLRVLIDGESCELAPIPQLNPDQKHTIKLIVDGLRIRQESRVRIQRSVETALSEGQGIVEWYLVQNNSDIALDHGGRFSLTGGCTVCGFSWPRLDARYFSANSLGQCKTCRGYGVDSSDRDAGIREEQGGDDSDESEMDHDLGFFALNCPDCRGSGLQSNLHAIRLGQYNIFDFHLQSIAKNVEMVQKLVSGPYAGNVATMRVMTEALNIMQRICEVGIGYLSPSRRMNTLSGGESQRLKLAGILSGSLRGILYVLDEPSQGLHASEVQLVMKTLQKLKNQGSTVLVVDHDEGFMHQADWILDLGPGGGQQGGKIMAKFRPNEAAKFASVSLTAMHLAQKAELKAKVVKAEKEPKMIALTNVRRHNLKIDRVRFLRAGLNVVTGVSGAGKSSLVLYTLYPRLCSMFKDHKIRDIDGIEGLSDVVLIDRKKLAKSHTSMPASYLGILGDIRDLFSTMPEAQIAGLTARDFSLSVEGGRCPECKGRGVVNLTMRFLADANVPCVLCQGVRFLPNVLNVRYLNHTISSLLDLTLDQTIDLLKTHKKIVAKLAPAIELGLGYLKLGQPNSSLSGGEAQRLKLVPYLYQGIGRKRRFDTGTVIIMDEPTAGLHFEDVNKLLSVLRKLVELNLTIVTIEHHPAFINAADWLIEIGPKAADEGGRLIFEGFPTS